ncbi:MAG TPA: DNA-binding response regulator [Comamonadaceae bacterium]|uniref:response regulator transcription factor n=1 Tax=Pulveribacter sp. TaxID=2678893 RepID=UPI000ED99CC7|nr:response regulator transcription factor [Pulveribacter sp.]HCL85613.1 DNA-binding response regulator [Comamonadaceae bacterium]
MHISVPEVGQTVAVVEDDEDIRTNVCRFLNKAGLNCWAAESAEDFYVRLLRERADLVVVDLGLPGEDGLSLVRRLTAQNIPVVVLTARGDLESRIAGLDAGALQYFVKPTDLHELVAGIRSQLRRTSPRDTDSGALARWRLDAGSARLVAPNQRSVELTTRELDLLGLLTAAQGGLVTKQHLVQVLGAGDVEDGFHRIESQLTRLRRKTLDASGMALPVRAVFGKGLVFIP